MISRALPLSAAMSTSSQSAALKFEILARCSVSESSSFHRVLLISNFMSCEQQADWGNFIVRPQKPVLQF